MRSQRFQIGLLLMSIVGCAFATPIDAAVPIARQGKAASVIVAPEGIIDWDEALPRVHWSRRANPEYQRIAALRLQRDSLFDLATYLSRMTGAEIEIVEALPQGDRRTPIYVGAAAERVFGPVGISKAGRFGFRVVAQAGKGVGLYGESPIATSYAIYELLHRLGCRWYMPSAMGEVVPDKPDLTVEAMDLKLAPATEYRGMWARQGDDDFFRRNRLNSGTDLSSGHTLPLSLEYWNEDEAHRIADDIIKRLDEHYVTTVSLSPHDGVMPTEQPEGRKHDPEPRVWEPAAGRWSTTDRVMMLANRVAERVGEKYPDVLFGMLAYVNYSTPPAREPVHPNVVPVIAPIDFNRHHPMNWPDHPNEYWLRDMVRGWSEVAERWGYYAYGMNLAEVTAPCPFITKWGTDLRILLDHGMTIWTPETMGGWESMMPGYYLAIRMTFHPDEEPDAILDEMWRLFYGPAAEPMGRYWRHIDRAWIEPAEYAGGLFGYLAMFTPEVLAEARQHIDDALAACKPGSIEHERVQLVNESLTLFELFMKMREDFAAARLANLDEDLAQWRARFRELVEQYADQKTFRAEPWSPAGAGVTLAEHYINEFVGHSYNGAAHVEETYARHGDPMLHWKWKHNPDDLEASLPWTRPDFNDSDWPVTHVVRDTWSSLGHHNTITDAPSGRSGRMAYRAAQRLDALPAGKRAYLWIGATDGTARVYVNGQHIPFVVPENPGPYFRRQKPGDVIDAFNGYARPALFDITDALKAGDNQFTILAERTWLNELGTGGLMGPVVIYREK